MDRNLHPGHPLFRFNSNPLCNGLQEARSARDGAMQGRSQLFEAAVPP